MTAAATLATVINQFGGLSISGPNAGAIIENANTIVVNYTIQTGQNAVSGGPITINSGITVTIPPNSTWTIT